MRRRDFITALGGAAVVWPDAARAQQPTRMRRVGVVMGYPESDPEGQLRVVAFQQSLEKLGWTVGRNLAIDYRWGTGDVEWARSVAAELLTLAPDVLVANGSPAMPAVPQATRTVPIVFIGVSDPVAQGYVGSLARPGGNVTGFSNVEPTLGGKWLELLKEIAPRVTRVTVLIQRGNTSAPLLFRSVAAAAQKLSVEAVAAPIGDVADIEAVMTMLGREPGAGLILSASPFVGTHRKLIVELAARHRLPAIYALRSLPAEGGLASYGINIPDLFRQAAGYVARILHGEKPADLPVQQPTKFELVINLKAAKALGLTVPQSVLLRADEVIQ